MFIKLPSGKIFRIEHIVECHWNTTRTELCVMTVDGDDSWVLRDDDAKTLYDYLSSISMIQGEKNV